MKQEIAWTNEVDEQAAVQKLVSQLTLAGRKYNLVMFFASVSYDFAELSKLLKEQFPESEVVGCSTSGEISTHGFTKHSIVLTTMECADTRVKGVLIKGAAKFPMIHKKDILDAMKACNIFPGAKRHDDSFAITFVNGLCNAEERLLSLLYSVVDDSGFQVLGGSAGDDLEFNTTYTSLNGQVVTDGGVVVFVKTTKRFVIEKENIFRRSGKKVKLTKVDTENRKLIEINDVPAATEYSRIVGIPESKIGEASLMHPIGRILGDNTFISSIASVNPDKSFAMYCRVMPNTVVDIMELGDVKKIIDDTCIKTKEAIPQPGFVFFINCILRTLQFDSDKNGDYLVSTYNKHFGKVCGFSSYGEQIHKVNSNQTLVVLAMEE